MQVCVSTVALKQKSNSHPLNPRLSPTQTQRPSLPRIHRGRSISVFDYSFEKTVTLPYIMIDKSSKNKSSQQKLSQHLLFHKPFFNYVIFLCKVSQLQRVDVSRVTVHTDTLWSSWFLLDLNTWNESHAALKNINYWCLYVCFFSATAWTPLTPKRCCYENQDVFWSHTLLVLLGCLAPVLHLLGKSGVTFTLSVDYSAGHSLVTSRQQLNTPGKSYIIYNYMSIGVIDSSSKTCMLSSFFICG